MTENLSKAKRDEVTPDIKGQWPTHTRQVVGSVAMSVYTLFVTPDHPDYHRVMEEESAEQPLQPPIDVIMQRVAGVARDESSHETLREPTLAEALVDASHMMQFVDHFPHQQAAGDYAISYETMQQLKDDFQELVDQQQGRPLDYAQQLAIALRQTDGDMAQALTNLWLVSRQYARWLDTVAIADIPPLDEDGILREMKEWRSLLAACKPAGDNEFQDPSGDTYYTWTHARARVLFGQGRRVHTQLGRAIFGRGTDVMHSVVHTVNQQSAPNDHRRAAAYGNAIGDAILSTYQVA